MLCTLLLALVAFVSPESGHEGNPVFRAVIDEGLTIGGTSVKLPAPTFRDGQSADEQRASLREIAGSMRGADEMLQESISAPHRLKLRDDRAAGATLRSGDLMFVLRGVDLDEIRPDEALRSARSGPVEAANMRFEARVLTPDDLKGSPATPASENEWFTHATGRLLDRIAVESTDRVVSSKSPDSLVFAARTDHRFDPDARFPNRWSTLELTAAGDKLGPPQPYAGGIGYVKITRLRGLEKAAVVEVHFAFAEPTAWFNGDPILRSKFGLIAQDQVRRLRRELQKKR
jgi:hypothetical protein